jgi:hypothetical protein
MIPTFTYLHKRKNNLFAGSDSGGERAAAIYTLVATTKLYGLHPENYLRDILAKIAEGGTINRIDELVPWRMIPAATTLIAIVDLSANFERTPSVSTILRSPPATCA